VVASTEQASSTEAFNPVPLMLRLQPTLAARLAELTGISDEQASSPPMSSSPGK